jgi:cation:H+ antiporter
MIFLADAAYRPGSVYSAAASSGLVLTGATVLLTVTLAAGLILRERRGIGFEGAAIPLIYMGAVVLLLVDSA